MFETAEIFDESVTELCLEFAPTDFEYNAITARVMNGQKIESIIEIHTFSEHQTSRREYYTKVGDLEGPQCCYSSIGNNIE